MKASGILFLLASFAWAEAPVVKEVRVEGGTTITVETVEYYLGVAAGDPLDEQALARNFHRFWESGLVEDLRVEVEDLPDGTVRIVVTVKERAKVSEYDFQGNKKISTSTLKEKLDTAGISLRRNVPLRQSELNRIRRTVLEEYAKEGYLSASVEPVLEPSGANQVKVTFRIDEGAKVRIGEIRFEGNQVFSDARLRRAMKKIKERSFIRPWGKKIIWNQEHWGEDSENLKKLYLNHGYKDVVVGEPRVELVAKHPDAPTQAKKKFTTVVTIPIQEGRQYRIASLKIDGATVFPHDHLRKFYELKFGGVYNYSQVEAGNEAIRTLYHSRGYIYAYTNQVLLTRPGTEDEVDVVVQVYEGDRWRLGRLEFLGNTKTQDRVLRREFRLFEGDWMDMTTFKRSVFKVNQLGYFKLTEDPVAFDFDQENKLVHVTIKGQEVGRTDIQFGAGYSELDRFFLQFMFNTRNFLGRGETLGVAVQSGTRADTYSLTFSEPYFLDKRMFVGGSVYKTAYDLVTQQRDAKGATAIWGVSVGDFGTFSLSYGFEDVFAKFAVVRTVPAGGDPQIPHRQPLPPPYPNMPAPTLYYEEASGVTSAITPGFGFDSRDDPFDPNQGVSYFARVRTAGGILGGDFNYVRPELGFSFFYPLSRRYILAANLEGGMIRPYGGSSIPLYDRYFLGGERSLRGFSYYSVVPRKANGDYFLTENGSRMGGDRYLQLNLEYQIKLGGPIKFILFADLGNTWHELQGWQLGLLRYSAGAELRITLPIFQAPLRFIYGVNLKPFPDEKRSDFQFSIGTTF
ncbi:MAG: outer membrane protein assembly factor BamA [Thermoanaerobaculum sp.]|nr:outer membrane protein assembly factor BamA [Thermoanaerobaculum sp.]